MIKIQELNAPLTVILIPIWDVLLILLREKKAFQNDLDRLEHWESMKFNTGFCTYDEVTLDTSMNQEKSGWRSVLKWGSGNAVGSRLTENQQCAWATKRANCILEGIKHC